MTQSTSHQNVRLSRGRHAGPEQGACVMELASMLAGERFSDHPRSVCPTLGAFLREYNDRMPDEHRGDLMEIAAVVVGTAGGRRTRRSRAARCRERLAELRPESRLHQALRPDWEASAACARAFLIADDHDGAMRFVRELVAMGREPAEPQRVTGPQPRIGAPTG